MEDMDGKAEANEPCATPTRIVDVTHAYLTYEPPPDASADQFVPERQVRLITDRWVVIVTVHWIAESSRPSAGRFIVIQHAIPPVSAKDSVGALPITASPTGEESERDSIETRVRGAIEDYLAKEFMKPGWDKFANAWSAPVCENFEGAANAQRPLCHCPYTHRLEPIGINVRPAVPMMVSG